MHAPATSHDDVLARLRDIFRVELDDDDLLITLATRQSDLKGWDSLAHVRLVSAIESEFDFQFSLAEIEEINSVHQFVELIVEHTQ
jgi:acyl carrier protein